MDIQSKVALITGASSGIGAGTAKLVAANGLQAPDHVNVSEIFILPTEQA